MHIMGEAQGLRLFLKAFDHGGSHLAHVHGAGEAIGVREEIAFERLCLRIDRAEQIGIVGGDGEKVLALAETCSLDGRGDFKDIVALRNDDGADENVSASDALEDLNCAGSADKTIFARLELLLRHGVVEQFKSEAAAHNSGTLKLGGNGFRG